MTVYAYLTEPLVATLGSAWLQRGTANVRFVKPLFDGEEFQVDGSIDSRGKDGLGASVRGATAATPECATLTATLPSGSPTPVNLAVYGSAPLPESAAGGDA